MYTDTHTDVTDKSIFKNLAYTLAYSQTKSCHILHLKKNGMNLGAKDILRNSIIVNYGALE